VYGVRTADLESISLPYDEGNTLSMGFGIVPADAHCIFTLYLPGPDYKVVYGMNLLAYDMGDYVVPQPESATVNAKGYQVRCSSIRCCPRPIVLGSRFTST
jgi:hypothetical protein